LIIVFSKIDVVNHAFAIEWMTDFESFEEAIKTNSSYMGTLTQSMGFLLEEFYNNFPCIGVSSVTGEGMDDMFVAVRKAAMEYEKGFKLEVEKMKTQKKIKEEKRIAENISKFKKDLGVVIDTNVDKDDNE